MAFNNYLPRRNSTPCQTHSKGGGRSPHSARGFYFVRLLSSPWGHWVKRDAPPGIAQRASTFPSSPPSHVGLLPTHGPALGHVSRSPSILHHETPLEPPRHPPPTDNKKNHQQHQEPTERNEVCIFWFHITALLARLAAEITSAKSEADEVINHQALPLWSPALHSSEVPSALESFMTLGPPI